MSNDTKLKKAAKHPYFAAFLCGENRIWRRERDSNPRVLSHKLISSQPRYDHFDISPYLVVFEFCTAFARPEVKCCHPKFNKNEAFAR